MSEDKAGNITIFLRVPKERADALPPIIHIPATCKICGVTSSNLKMCVICRNFFCPEHIEFAPDPYAEEVNEVKERIWECENCRHESSDNI